MRSELVSILEPVCRESLQRFLHSIDCRDGSESIGIADREYWAWKTKDFPNGTWQGGLLPMLMTQETLDISSRQLKKLIQILIEGTLRIQRSNGSFEEAYPLESSFAVTGLVVADLLSAVVLFPGHFDEDDIHKLKMISERAVIFLSSTPETHGVISNHLMSSALAVDLFHVLFSKNSSFENVLKVCASVSEEGWFMEYSGADPGYQSLLNHYLMLAYLCGAPIKEQLSQTVTFVTRFLFPDYSFSGHIGSRGTKVFYPSGFFDPREATFPIEWFRRHVSTLEGISPLHIDGGNFIPLWSSWAALYYLIQQKNVMVRDHDIEPLDFEDSYFVARNLPEKRYFILSRISGAFYLFQKKGSGYSRVGLGYLKNSDNVWRTIYQSHEFADERIKIQYRIQRMPQRFNNGLYSCILRVYSLVLYICPPLQRLLKLILARFVMGGESVSKAQATVEVHLSDSNGITLLGLPHDFSVVQSGFPAHMASANYFQMEKT